MKSEIGTLDATPSKRLFHSIIADYDLNKSICELIDNGLDVWVRSGRKKAVSIDVSLDKTQQRIVIIDNAGGLPREELSFIVGPGQTGTKPTDETIGIFGVGTKRAVIALAQDIKIRTRHASKETYQIDLDESWIENDDWELPYYEVDKIATGTTEIELQRLRLAIDDAAIDQLREHLGATYAKFIVDGKVSIDLNNEQILPKFFDNWAYPPKFSPREYSGSILTDDGRTVATTVTAGLARESSPATGEYGVYLYCNDRLIARAVKNIEVGFARGLAGLPHPKLSLVRVIVSLSGDARDMPWNSSKSDINIKSHVFQAFHSWLIQVVKDYAAVSRIWTGDWPSKIFKYTKGTVENIPIADFPTAKRSFLPPMPKSRLRYGDVVTAKNKAVAKNKPWVTGLYEGVIAAEFISKQNLEQKDRIAFIVLDSTLEIAFKEYLVNEATVPYSDAALQKLFTNRTSVHDEIKKYVPLSKVIWGKITYFYNLRNKFVHERATVGIADNQLKEFRTLVESVLKMLFKLNFGG